MATGGDPQVAEDGSVAMDTEERKKTERDLELEMDDEYVLDLQSNATVGMTIKYKLYIILMKRVQCLVGVQQMCCRSTFLFI